MEQDSNISIILTTLFEGELVSGELICAFDNAVVIMTDDGSLAVPCSAIQAESIEYNA